MHLPPIGAYRRPFIEPLGHVTLLAVELVSREAGMFGTNFSATHLNNSTPLAPPPMGSRVCAHARLRLVRASGGNWSARAFRLPSGVDCHGLCHKTGTGAVGQGIA